MNTGWEKSMSINDFERLRLTYGYDGTGSLYKR